MIRIAPERVRFELFVDLIFSTSGWRRLGAMGGTQKSVDMELELPSTGDRAFVQVKSSTTQGEFDSYQEEFAATGFSRMFYVFHTGSVSNPRQDITLIDAEAIGRLVVRSGLVSWLVQRVG